MSEVEKNMKLYVVPLAPNPVRVMLYIAERAALGVDMGIEQIIVNTLKGRHKEPAHLARNPFGTLPVLETPSGRYLVESRVIIDYLEDCFEDHRMFSADPDARAHERDLERICEIRLGNLMAQWVHVYKSPLGFPPNPDRAAELEKAMQPASAYLDALLSDNRPFLAGDKVTMADCTLQGFLQFMRFTQKDVMAPWRNIQRWDAAYRARPEVASVLTI